MRKVSINSKLIGKDELFRVLALGYSCPSSLALLMIGEPGTAKSQAIIDFMESIYVGQKDLTFSLQLSEGTKIGDLQGRVDVKHLVTQNDFRFSRPICKAKGIYIDEVSRGSSGVRNAMLAIMNEKKIIAGDDSCDLIWELFVGSTNSIPTEETNDAFWDRFLVKFAVSATSPEDMLNFVMNPVMKSRDICIPDQTDFDAISFNRDHIKAFIDLAKKKNLLSDRSISKIVDIAKCVKIIWELDSDEEALGQTAKLICSSISDELMTKIISEEQRSLKDKLNLLKTTTNSGRVLTLLTELGNLETKLIYNKPLFEQEKIRKYIENSIMNSGNEVAIDRYKSISKNVDVLEFIFGNV